VISILRFILVHGAAHEGKITGEVFPNPLRYHSNDLSSLESGTYAVVWSTIEVNVAIICASLLVMKPLFARFMPAIVSEQPVSAREDKRSWRGLTGLTLLNEGIRGNEDEEKAERRDTAVALEADVNTGRRSENTQRGKRRYSV
jgi:hypothetical protein